MADVPGVGKNLHDHPSIFGLTWTVRKGSASRITTLANPLFFKDYVYNRKVKSNLIPTTYAKCTAKYLPHGICPLTSPFSLEGNAWSRSEEGDPDWPELQYLFISGGPAMDYGLFITDLIGFRRDSGEGCEYACDTSSVAARKRRKASRSIADLQTVLKALERSSQGAQRECLRRRIS
ncbi:hypothetical protein O3P69_009907 [Scylla paramamosain]|uniref:Glucose-methanol-choline oxidoreductase N-terminal domain-containing protein n=1 Tax=Scylla paramamosain TaxID=85552 RepID=A0AAW0SN97_SCYPA